jgi:hypothetical protein
MSHEHNGNAQFEQGVDLDVLALRYVTNELTEDELGAFEARLAEDQLARESVSRMVLLGTAVSLEGVSLEAPFTEGEPGELVASTPQHAADSTVKFTWFGGWRLAAAAALFLAIGLVAYLNRGDAETTSPGEIAGTEQPLEDEAQDLIASYLAFGDLPDAAREEAGLDTSLDPFENSTLEGAGGEVTLDIGGEAPSWMIMALAK